MSFLNENECLVFKKWITRLRVYKYIKKEHYLEFKENGKLYINTLYNLRACPHEPVRDKLEGTHRISFDSTNKPLSLTGKEFHKIIPQMKLNKSNVNRKFYFDKYVHFEVKAFDAFIFCSSLKLDSELSKRFDYNSYFEIIDPIKFGDLLFECIHGKKALDWYRQDVVVYRDKPTIVSKQNKATLTKHPFNEVSDFCFCKPKAFEVEREYRFVYFPLNKDKIEPIVISCPELRTYCIFH